MKYILLIVIATFSLNLSAAGKMKFLSKYDFNKLDKIEKEFYVKKLYKIVSQFEVLMNKKNKFSAGNSFSFPNLINEAYARSFDSDKYCIIGGRILDKKGRCKYGRYKRESGCPEPGWDQGAGFECGPIYGSICVPFNLSTLSKDCSDAAIAKDTFKPSYIDVAKFKQYVGQVCRGNNSKSDGCTQLAKNLEINLEIAEEILNSKIEASKVCETKEIVQGRARVKKVEVCKIKILDTESNTHSIYEYDKKDIDTLVAAINQGTIAVPDISGIDMNELSKKLGATKCDSVVVDQDYRDTATLLQNKCPSVAVQAPAADTDDGAGNN